MDPGYVGVGEPTKPHCSLCRSYIALANKELKESEKSYARGDVFAIQLSSLRTEAAQDCEACRVIISVVEPYDLPNQISVIVNITCPIKYLRRETKQMRVIIKFPSQYLAGTYHKVEIFRVNNTNNPNSMSIWKNVVRWPSLVEDTSCDEAYDTVNDWITDCFRDHQGCSKHKTSRLPKRVLEISGDKVFLRELQDTYGTYACLSHCWGKKGVALQLNFATLHDFRSGICNDQLPKTFRDAVKICSKLAIRFIWIDAMCIMQDDVDDWKAAAATMASIYQNSYITIAATWSADSNGGCFSQTRDRYKARKLGGTGLFVKEGPPDFPAVNGSEDIFTDWPLLSRAWVFQERRLSPRVIYYARDLLYWECANGILYGDGSGRLRCESLSNAKFEDRDDEGIHRTWEHIVRNYSNLQLTKSSDLLPALAGVVERESYWRSVDDAYIAGMWKNNLYQELAFYNAGGPRSNSSAPTWSWVHFEGQVDWISVSGLHLSEITKVAFTRVGPPNIGEVTDANIKIKGPIIPVTVTETTSEAHGLFALETPQNASRNTVLRVQLPRPATSKCFPNIILGVTLTVLILTPHTEFHDGAGLLLGKLSSGRFRKIAAVNVRHCEMSDGALLNQKQAEEMYECIATLPVQELQII